MGGQATFDAVTFLDARMSEQTRRDQLIGLSAFVLAGQVRVEGRGLAGPFKIQQTCAAFRDLEFRIMSLVDFRFVESRPTLLRFSLDRVDLSRRRRKRIPNSEGRTLETR